MSQRVKTSLQSLLQKYQFGPRSLPVFLLAVCFLAFGLLTFNLGFFQDDWHHVYYYSQGGFEALEKFLLADGRPLAFVVYDALFALLGSHTFLWHLALLIIRFFTALAFWGVLNVIWGGFHRENALVSILFALYPVYLLQPLSVAYSLHWTIYLVYMVSILMMLWSVKKGSIYLSVGAILLQVFHLLMMEYYFGLELLRPVFLWLILSNLIGLERLRKTFQAWLPFLVVDVLYIFYRASLQQQLFGYERFGSMFLLDMLRSQPASLIPFYFRAFLQDFTEILLNSWYEALNPSVFDFGTLSSWLIWIIVLFVGASTWVYLNVFRQKENSPDSEQRWARQALTVGLIAVLFGILPGWVIGSTVYGTNPMWNDRYAMAAMFGAGMVWVALIYTLVQKPHHRYLLFGILIALAIGSNLRTDIKFKYSWEKQERFYWQLYWRAPHLEPNTLLVSEGEIIPYMGVYPLAFAVNALYPKSGAPTQLDYWYSDGYEHLPRWDDFRTGAPLEYSKHTFTFKGNSTDSVSVYFVPEEDKCLWVLPPQYAIFPFFSNTVLRESMPVSNLDRIHREPEDDWRPPREIFGREPKGEWCYYFEKADLAVQYQEWDEAARLWKEADQNGHRPGHGLEYFPFIQAFAYTNDWDSAVRLTRTAGTVSEQMDRPLCSLWNEIKARTASSPQRDDAIHKVNDRFACEP